MEGLLPESQGSAFDWACSLEWLCSLNWPCAIDSPHTRPPACPCWCYWVGERGVMVWVRWDHVCGDTCAIKDYGTISEVDLTDRASD